ncbi:hypothetical protein [Peterkaempfera griseoplana]|uniref:hypothetical protein n=1 Tax=Peterkaempfera griseoplana TaxID=66896 RepID=UPI0006E36F0F|nr:hypothetical protein [Peterkaempfera griseoplana]
MTCFQLHELGAELSLGVLPARERAAAVAHLDGCARCRAEVHRLTLAGDALLSLVPGAEPPVGFEDRVMARLGPSLRPVQRLRRRRRLVLVAAAAVAALATGAGGWALGSAEGTATRTVVPAAAQTQLRSGQLMADGRVLGRVYVHGGPSPWLFMSVDADGVPGPVRCTVQRSDGSTVSVGTFPLRDGYGSWGAGYPAGPDAIAVRLLSAGGTVLATAHLPAAGG